MRIGIIGAGSMGGILARHLTKLGHHISIANSRGPESLTALAGEIGEQCLALSTTLASTLIGQRTQNRLRPSRDKLQTALGSNVRFALLSFLG